MNFVTKIFLEVVNLFCNNQIAFTIARKFCIFDAVFVMYPADYQFADYFTFRWRQWLITWKPFIVGVARHPSGKKTLMFAISAFVDGKDRVAEGATLRLLHSRVDRIREYLGATSTHFAGTLPGRFTALRIRRGDDQKNERKATQENVVRAVMSLREQLAHGPCSPVVILGSNGYIGKEVTAQLLGVGISVVGIEKEGIYENGACREGIYTDPGTPHIFVNIAAPEAINQYVDPQGMSSMTTFLNEVYPAPCEDVVRQMKDLGVRVFHIAGVMAEVTPSFPSSYGGAIPCCAALPGIDYSVKVIEL